MSPALAGRFFTTKPPGKPTHVSVCLCVSHSVMSDSVTPWIVAHQNLPCMGFSRQEYWSGLSFPSPGGLPNLGLEPRPPALQAGTILSALLPCHVAYS